MASNKLTMMKVSPNAMLPHKATKQSAAYDLYASEEIKVVGGAPYPALVKTGIAMKFPDGYYGQIECRSGLALKHGACVLGGVIDSDYYPGEIMVMMKAAADFTIKPGDRIAQIIIHKIFDGDVEVVGKTNELQTHAGFGSTGTK